MSQKSNILTIRFPNKSLNLDTKNTNQFLKNYKLEKSIKQSLEKKGILLTQSIIKNEKTNYFVNLNLFFGTQKLMRYKAFIGRILVKKTRSVFIKKLIQESLKSKGIFIKINVLNHKLKNNETKKYFQELKRFKNILFSRQFSLFIDFIKLTNLFIIKQISTKTYLKILGKVFKILPKNKHARYFLFLDQLFKMLIKESKGEIKGIKLEVSGKLKGKLRSSSQKISEGNISNQSIAKNINYSQTHVYTLYGSFGIKFWVNYSS